MKHYNQIMERLEAENKRLREALERIANGKYNGRLAVILAVDALGAPLIETLKGDT